MNSPTVPFVYLPDPSALRFDIEVTVDLMNPAQRAIEAVGSALPSLRALEDTRPDTRKIIGILDWAITDKCPAALSAEPASFWGLIPVMAKGEMPVAMPVDLRIDTPSLFQMDMIRAGLTSVPDHIVSRAIAPEDGIDRWFGALRYVMERLSEVYGDWSQSYYHWAEVVPNWFRSMVVVSRRLQIAATQMLLAPDSESAALEAEKAGSEYEQWLNGTAPMSSETLFVGDSASTKVLCIDILGQAVYPDSYITAKPTDYSAWSGHPTDLHSDGIVRTAMRMKVDMLRGYMRDAAAVMKANPFEVDKVISYRSANGPGDDKGALQMTAAVLEWYNSAWFHNTARTHIRRPM